MEILDKVLLYLCIFLFLSLLLSLAYLYKVNKGLKHVENDLKHLNMILKSIYEA
jgi:hypothetical protein